MDIQISKLGKLAQNNGTRIIEAFYRLDNLNMLDTGMPKDSTIKIIFSDGKELLGSILVNEEERGEATMISSSDGKFKRKNCFSTNFPEDNRSSFYLQLADPSEFNLEFNYLSVHFDHYWFSDGYVGKCILIFNYHE